MDPEGVEGVQIHDYNPGYLGGWPSGVFWTLAIPNPTVHIQHNLGRARWRMEELEIPDYTDAANAFADGPSLPGVVSFEVNWMRKPGSDDSDRYQYSHTAEPAEPDSYWLDYWDTAATLEWTSRTPSQDFTFTSYEIGKYPDGRQHGQHFAVVGRERNGIFFPKPEGS